MRKRRTLRKWRVAVATAVVLVLGASYLILGAEGGSSGKSRRPSANMRSAVGSEYEISVRKPSDADRREQTCFELRVRREDGSESGFGHCFPKAERDVFQLVLFFECREPKEAFLVGVLRDDVARVEISFRDGQRIQVTGGDGIPAGAQVDGEAFVADRSGLDMPDRIVAVGADGATLEVFTYKGPNTPCSDRRFDTARVVVR